jgi:hypothetical protein
MNDNEIPDIPDSPFEETLWQKIRNKIIDYSVSITFVVIVIVIVYFVFIRK